MRAGGQSKRTFLPFGHKTKHLPVKPTPPSSVAGHAIRRKCNNHLTQIFCPNSKPKPKSQFNSTHEGTGGVSVNKRATLRTLQNPHLRKAGLFTRGKKSQRISDLSISYCAL
ncbi:hypothetical protein NL676_007305 [Syzygium grande]|nr:hypothetical protein NL676_007305 [Syzygium grande]